MTQCLINAKRLLARIQELGKIGRDTHGSLTRLAASDTDKAGRDQFARWIAEAGLELAVDRVGNMFGIWNGANRKDDQPIMIGSHIDTVVNAGVYDGCYGVLSGLEVIQSLRESGFTPKTGLVVAAFTNEEGVRYAPDMLGSLVYVGGVNVKEALAITGVDGSVFGSELSRIGYAGSMEPGAIKPKAYLELHVEQGPLLDHQGVAIGAVENLQGISWQQITIEGTANHAGTTPTRMRRDAGLAAARVVTFLRDSVVADSATAVATVGIIELEPNVINIIPARASFTVDLRDPDENHLRAMEAKLAKYLTEISAAEDVAISTQILSRFEPVIFDNNLVAAIETAAAKRSLSTRRMTSGAGHDAQMMARICPTAMIFVPSIGGISHNPRESTLDGDLVNGANVLLDVVRNLAAV